MKKYIVAGAIIILLAVIAFFVFRKKDDEKEMVEDVAKPPQQIGIVEKKIYEIDDEIAKKAIEKRMSVIHQNNRGTDFQIDVLKSTTSGFQILIKQHLSKQSTSSTKIKVGYSEIYNDNLKYVAYTNQIDSASQGVDYVKGVLSDLIDKCNMSSEGAVDYLPTQDLLEKLATSNPAYCCKDVTKYMRLFEDISKYITEVLKVASKYQTNLKEQAIQELRSAGWLFIGYDKI